MRKLVAQVVFTCSIRQRLKRSTKLIQNEKGIAIPLFCVFLVAITMAFALMVDFSNVLITRHRLQSVADAGALAGASMTKVTGTYDALGNVTGYVPVTDLAAATNEANDYITKNVNEIVLSNPNVTISNIVINAPTADRVYVEIDYSIKTLLLGGVYNLSPIRTMTAKVEATAQIKL